MKIFFRTVLVIAFIWFCLHALKIYIYFWWIAVRWQSLTLKDLYKLLCFPYDLNPNNRKKKKMVAPFVFWHQLQKPSFADFLIFPHNFCYIHIQFFMRMNDLYICQRTYTFAYMFGFFLNEIFCCFRFCC